MWLAPLLIVLAQGSTTAVQVEQFEPMTAPAESILNVTTSEILPSLEYTGGLVTHYSDGSLRLVTEAGVSSTTTEVVGPKLTAELMGAVGLFGWAELDLALPLVAYQDGVDLGPFDRPGTTVKGFALGDLRVIPRVRIWNTGDLRFSAAVPVYLPTGDDQSFNSDGAVRFEARAVADYLHRSGFLVAANVGYQVRPERTVLNHISDDTLRWGAGVATPRFGQRVRGLASLFGSVPTTTTARATPVEALGGVEVRLPANLVGTVAGGGGLGRSVGTPEYRVMLGVHYELPRPVKSTVAATTPLPTPTPKVSIDELPIAPMLGTPTPAPQVALKGIVRDADSGEPLAGVTLTLGTEPIQTDAYGQFSVMQKPGEVVAQIAHVGYANVTRTFTLTAGQALNIAIDLPLAGGESLGSLSGDVRSRAGRVLATAVVVVETTDGPQNVEVDEAGAFHADLPPGKYNVRVEAPGFASKVRTLQVVAGELTIYNFLLSPGG